MPFKNWYTVRIVKLSNRVYSYLTDSANIVPSQWQFIHTDKVENEYVGKVLPNGSLCHMGLYRVSEYSGIKSKISRTHFLDSDNKVEIAGNGYREDYDASGDRIVMSFCFGGTDRYNENPELTTGLDMIYCAPQR